MNAVDPYATLGVSRDAGDDEIRRAFRKLAKELHPDLHPQDTTAAERFKRVFGSLRHPWRSPEASSLRLPVRLTPAASRAAITDSSTPTRTEAPEVSVLNSAASSRICSPRNTPKTGIAPPRPPIAAATVAAFPGADRTSATPWRLTSSKRSPASKSVVTMPEGGVLDLAVPEGVSNGQVLRLRGKGGLGLLGGETGDALVEIKIRPQPPLHTRKPRHPR